MHLSKKIKKVALISAIMAAGICPQLATAQTQYLIQELPTNWRLENYDRDDQLVVWFTGAQECNQGQIEILGQPDRLNRFWALVLTAKSTNKRVGIHYQVSAGICRVSSFFIDN